MRPDRTDRNALLDVLIAAGCDVRGNKIRCEYHQEVNPSASIKAGADGAWRYKCFVCDAAGDAWDLSARALNMSIEEWLRANPAEPSIPAAPITRIEGPKMRIWSTVEAMAEEHAHSARGVVEAIHRYADAQDQPFMVQIRIVLPDDKTFRGGRPVAGGWTNTIPAAPRPLYRLPEVMRSTAVVVVEGEKKADLLWLLGIAATTSANGGGNAKHSDWSVLAGKRLVLWPDHDGKGRSYRDEVKTILAAMPNPPELGIVDPAKLCVAMPETGDVVDFCRLVGGDAAAQTNAVREVLKAAAPPGPALKLAASIEAQIAGRSTLVQFPDMRALSLASRALLPGAVCLLAGHPGSTKSFLVLQWLGAMLRGGVPAAGLFLEESQAFHLQRALAQAESNGEMTKPEWSAANPEAIRAALHRHHDDLDRLGRALTCRGDPTLAGAADWVVRQAQIGARVIVVDPITMAAAGTEKSWQADQAFMAQVKPAIEAAGSSLILVTHPRKGRFVGPPTMDDLAGSAAYARAAQSVLWLEMVDDGEVMTTAGSAELAQLNRRVRILKARNGPGTGGAVGLLFDARALRFIEAGLVVAKPVSAAQQNRTPRGVRYGRQPDSNEDAYAQ